MINKQISIQEFIENIPDIEKIFAYNKLARLTSGTEISVNYNWRGNYYKLLKEAFKIDGWKSDDSIALFNKPSLKKDTSIIMNRNIGKNNIFISFYISNYMDIRTILRLDLLRDKK